MNLNILNFHLSWLKIFPSFALLLYKIIRYNFKNIKKHTLGHSWDASLLYILADQLTPTVGSNGDKNRTLNLQKFQNVYQLSRTLNLCAFLIVSYILGDEEGTSRQCSGRLGFHSQWNFANVLEPSDGHCLGWWCCRVQTYRQFPR